MLRSKPLEFGKARLQGFDIKLASEGEMVRLMLQLGNSSLKNA